MSSYRDSPVVLEGSQGSLAHGVDSNIDNLPQVVDDNENWDFDGAIGGKSTQRVGV